jgi:predicted nucleotidyltransferase
MKINQENIRRIKYYFEDKPVLKAYVFGSVAKNEAGEDSDIDILVDLDYSSKIGLLFIQMKLDLENLLHTKVDLVSSNGLSPYIKSQIEKEKKLIYERS